MVVELELSEDEAWALAEFVKRVTWSEMRACAVDDQEILRRLQHQKRMMPDIAGIIHTLIATRQKASQRIKIRRAVIGICRRHHHQPVMRRQRHESLRAERVAFHHPDGDRVRPAGATKDRQDRPADASPDISPNINIRKIVKARRRAFIDHDPLCPVGLDHLPEGGKTSRCERCDR